MNAKLFIESITKFAGGVVLVGLLVFVPAGTVAYWPGWLLIGLLFTPMLLAGIVMMYHNPELLKRRLNAKEKRSEQGLVVKLSGLMFIVSFVVAGLDYRFVWFPLPTGVIIGASAVFLIAYGLYAEVLRENSYLSRTIEVQEGQQVVDTGLYGVVRHPMYAVTLLLFLAMPLILGSLYATGVMLVYPILIVKRIKDEEAFLKNELPGYTAYMNRVKFRLIPGIW